MGMKTEETRQGFVGEQSPEARQMMQQLAQMTAGTAGQFGDLSQLASGQLQLNPQDRALIQQAQEASGQQAQQQMEQQMQTILRQLEDTAIGRGIQGSSLEAVNNALIGQDFQRQLAQMAMQQQGQAANQMLNMPFQRAGTQINANQALMQRLVGGSQVGLGYDQAMRQATGGMTVNRQEPFSAALMQMGTGLGGSWLSTLNNKNKED